MSSRITSLSSLLIIRITFSEYPSTWMFLSSSFAAKRKPSRAAEASASCGLTIPWSGADLAATKCLLASRTTSQIPPLRFVASIPASKFNLNNSSQGGSHSVAHSLTPPSAP
ncbi:hypothetical protein Vadar_007884 [Vaccinium darrowii]|uniref:Uncharacterized protein n=1 Tax=Vaccinium darrowii TaxID=229202 RepID=A0ACB7XPX9_9ERIC|nr:hypothetical protein Vadar_007884 [Vaccinium darrowii]